MDDSEEHQPWPNVNRSGKKWATAAIMDAEAETGTDILLAKRYLLCFQETSRDDTTQQLDSSE